MAKMVIPRSRSSGFESIESVKSGSQCRSILSTKDVLPWSTWAITATFRSFLLVWIIAPSCSAAIFAVETAATACGAEEKAARSAANATARSGSAGASSRAGRMLEKLRARRRVVPADIMARVARVGFAQFFFPFSFLFFSFLFFFFSVHFCGRRSIGACHTTLLRTRTYRRVRSEVRALLLSADTAHQFSCH